MHSPTPWSWWVVGENARAAHQAANSAAWAAEKGGGDGEKKEEEAGGEQAGDTTTTAAVTWTRPALSKMMQGWEETEAAIRSAVQEQGPFDGVMAGRRRKLNLA